MVSITLVVTQELCRLTEQSPASQKYGERLLHCQDHCLFLMTVKGILEEVFEVKIPFVRSPMTPKVVVFRSVATFDYQRPDIRTSDLSYIPYW